MRNYLMMLVLAAVWWPSPLAAQSSPPCWVCIENSCAQIFPNINEDGGRECVTRCQRRCLCFTRGVCQQLPAVTDRDGSKRFALPQDALDAIQARDPLLGEFLWAFREGDGTIQEAVIRSGSVGVPRGSAEESTFTPYRFMGEIRLTAETLVLDLQLKGHPEVSRLRAELGAQGASGSVEKTTRAGVLAEKWSLP